MKTWRAIIIDDEPLARLEIKRLLAVHSQINIVGEADSVPTAKASIEKLQPDLLFLDIDLGTQSGFDLLECTERNFQIIFVTAYDKFAIRAFKINALDYLLKPVHPERLNESINRLGNPFKSESKFELGPFDKILIGNHGCSKFISVNSITYIVAFGDYTRIFIADELKGLVHHTIKKWMERLPENMFAQVHRSFIININQVEEIKKTDNTHFKVSLKQTKSMIPVSRKYLKQLKTKFRID